MSNEHLKQLSNGRGSYPLIQHGKNLLIAENIASQPSSSNIPKPGDPLYSAFQQFLKQQKDNNPSFSKIVSEEDNDDSSEYILTPHKDLIIPLEEKDIMLYFEDNDDPWNLFSKYLDAASYATCFYKSRNYYENILISTGTCEISHFSSSADKKVYNFSKVIFNRIISAEEWGLSTLREREFLHHHYRILFEFFLPTFV